jgi:hypothetical protein
MGAVTLLAEALAQGGKVLWDPPERPKLILPKGVRERLEADRETIREVLRRAAIFRGQANVFIRGGRLLPVLALPDRPEGEGCWSCGQPAPSRRYRCDVCGLAVALALGGNP